MNRFSRQALSVASGLLLSLAYPTPQIAWLAWGALVPFFWAIEEAGWKEAILLGFLTGLAFFGPTVYWVVHVTLPGAIALIVYLALYFAVLALIVNRFFFRRREKVPRWASLVFVPALWVCLEWARNHVITGFGWALLGYSQYQNLSVIQIADVVGAYGVSFLIAFVNIWIYEKSRLFRQALAEKWPLGRIVFRFGTMDAALAVLLVGTLVYGWGRLAPPSAGASDPLRPLKIALVQGNIPQDEKWDRDFQRRIFDRYVTLTQEAAKEKPDLILWPETSFPGIFTGEPILERELQRLVRSLGVWLLFGVATPAGESFYNSAVLLGPDGSVRDKHDKLHLVPFGEFVPFERRFPWLRDWIPAGMFVKGNRPTIFEGPEGYRYAVLVCFEDIFPDLVSRFVDQKPDFLVNITNDAWFKRSGAARQHAQASVFRAVENRLPVVRVANTGLSCFIDANGRITERVQDGEGRELFVPGVAAREVAIVRSEGSLFRRFHGDWFLALCFFATMVLFPYPRWLEPRGREGGGGCRP